MGEKHIAVWVGCLRNWARGRGHPLEELGKGRGHPLYPLLGLAWTSLCSLTFFTTLLDLWPTHYVLLFPNSGCFVLLPSFRLQCLIGLSNGSFNSRFLSHVCSVCNYQRSKNSLLVNLPRELRKIWTERHHRDHIGFECKVCLKEVLNIPRHFLPSRQNYWSFLVCRIFKYEISPNWKQCLHKNELFI